MKRFFRHYISLLAAVGLAFGLVHNSAAYDTGKQTGFGLARLGLLGVGEPADALATPERPAGQTPKLAPGSHETEIASLAARLLVRSHFSRQSLNDEVSSKFLDQYLDALDPLHMVMLQADVDEFEKYRTALDDLTFQSGDTTPAYEIFRRFHQRFDQQVEFVTQTLEKKEFNFTADDYYQVNRRKLPRPKDLEEAKRLWCDRLRYEYLQEKLNKEKPDEIIKIVSRRYSRLQRMLNEYDNEDILQIYLTALAHVYDPHSDYMGAAQLENFAIGMKLSLFGIGAVLRSEDGYCKIQEILPGGPAERSKKLKPNDRIIAVAQGDDKPVDAVDMKLTKVVDLIRGPKGTTVRLVIIPADASDPSVRRTVTLIRDEIKLEAREAKAKIIQLPDTNTTRIGIIDLPSFYSEIPTGDKTNGLKSTTTDVARLLKKLKQENVQGVILDLRRNGGGALDEAIELTGLFIESGPVVQVAGADGKISLAFDTDPSIAYKDPLLVLTSRYSASASEILAGALQDYDRALVVGDVSTFGKGTVQQLISLDPILQHFGINASNEAGALKVTIRKFYLPNGPSTQLKGVTPHIVLPSMSDAAEVGEQFLPNALQWDKITRADFEKYNMVQAHLARLQEFSASRMATNKEFALLGEEIERAKTAMASKTVSLNEQKRLKEKQEADERQNARKSQAREQAHDKLTIFELTLKDVDKPGLPLPLDSSKDKSASSENDDSPPGNGETPAKDIILTEAERILIDLIALSTSELALLDSAQFIE